MHWLKRWRGLIAVAMVPLTAMPVWACSDRSSVWDWDRCWVSLTRWLLLGVIAAGWWFVCFHRLFPLMLAPSRADAPWPGVAFRRCLALFWLLLCVTFIALFGWLSDELSSRTTRAFPAALSWLNRNWPLLVALLVGLVGALVIWAPWQRARGQGAVSSGG
jgi:hypothetical protein